MTFFSPATFKLNLRNKEQEILTNIINAGLLQCFLTSRITRDFVYKIFKECETYAGDEQEKYYRSKDRFLRRLKIRLEKQGFKGQLEDESRRYKRLLADAIGDTAEKAVKEKNERLEKYKFKKEKQTAKEINKINKLNSDDRDDLLYRYKILVDNLMEKANKLKDSNSTQDTAKQLQIVRALEPAINLINTYINQEEIKEDYTIIKELEESREEIKALEVRIQDLTQ